MSERGQEYTSQDDGDECGCRQRIVDSFGMVEPIMDENRCDFHRDLLAERDALKAEAEAQHDGNLMLLEENKRLRAEVERLRSHLSDLPTWANRAFKTLPDEKVVHEMLAAVARLAAIREVREWAKDNVEKMPRPSLYVSAFADLLAKLDEMERG